MGKKVGLVEPGLVTDAKLNPSGWHCRGSVEPGVGNALFFPHVDSCAGVAWVLDDGYMIGAHMGMPGKGGPPEWEWGLLYQWLSDTRNNRGVKAWIFIGQYGKWADLGARMGQDRGESGAYMIFDCANFGGGVDAWVRDSQVWIAKCSDITSMTYRAIPEDDELSLINFG